ncbi:hypothetical protein CPB85DRAFT_79678 [Mucidula mucida]|nr:hypothetical protein CPB85DRAFT_79678 [Mucidula mucida]
MDMNSVLSTANGEEIPLAMLAGPRLLGMFFNWFLLGVLFVQVYIFYLTFAGESNRIRVMVYILLLVETLQTFLMTSDAFHWFVFGWGERERLNDIHTKWLNVPLMSGLISGAVQTFFSWQILRVSKSYYMPCLILLISLMQSSAAVATGVKVKLANQLSRAVFVPVVINHTGEAVADVFISISMTFLLFRMKSGFKSTDKRLVNIIRLFVETGLITCEFVVLSANQRPRSSIRLRFLATVAILDVIFFFLFPVGLILDDGFVISISLHLVYSRLGPCTNARTFSHLPSGKFLRSLFPVP